MVKILDCTTRDGGSTVNWNYNDEYILNLINLLNDLGVEYYEIGYRNHFDKEGKGPFYNCTKSLLEKFYRQKGNLKLGVMTDASRFCEKDFPDAKDDCLDFVRIAGHPKEISKILEITEFLHEKGYKIFVQLMDISNIDEIGYLELFKWKHKNILESIYMADTYGTITPDDVEKYYNKLKILGYDKISFHGHNKQNLALQNSLKAIELGAYSIDIAQNKEGRHGGNLTAAEFFTNR